MNVVLTAFVQRCREREMHIWLRVAMIVLTRDVVELHGSDAVQRCTVYRSAPSAFRHAANVAEAENSPREILQKDARWRVDKRQGKQRGSLKWWFRVKIVASRAAK